MEAMWRLERVKYGLEVVFGIGAEHTAGYLSVTAEKVLDENAKAAIKTAARNIMSAHEGSYAAWPQGYTGELIDVPFQGGTVVLDAIRYFGILKLALLDLQWMALGTLSPYGSNSASLDASDFFVAWFNAELSGIVKQADEQIGKRLFDYPINKAAFPGMTRRPVLGISPVQKDIKLADMGAFLTAVSTIMPMGDDDWLAVRTKTEFLPDVLPEVETTPKPDEPDAGDEKPDDSLDSEGGPDMEEIGRNGHRDEPIPEAEMQAASNGGAMVAFFLENEFAKSLAINPGELPDGSEATLPEELHITLAFLGDAARMGAEMRERVTAVIRDIAGKFAPLSGHIGGAGRFLKEEDGKSAFYAHPDVIGVQEFRQELAKALIAAGAPVSMEHGFTPHITLAYVPVDAPAPAVIVPTGGFKLDKLALSWGLEREYFPLVGERAAEFAFRPFAVGSSEQTIDVTPEAMLPTEDIDAAVRHWKMWAKDNAPELAALIDAEAESEVD
jgi:2'-5' RNA ligase